jgi:hypothetical protein
VMLAAAHHQSLATANAPNVLCCSSKLMAVKQIQKAARAATTASPTSPRSRTWQPEVCRPPEERCAELAHDDGGRHEAWQHDFDLTDLRGTQLNLRQQRAVHYVHGSHTCTSA